jgi:hypothetical protein
MDCLYHLLLLTAQLPAMLTALIRRQKKSETTTSPIIVYFNPPESRRLCPVMYPVRHNMVTTFAHSSVLPLLPTGIFFTSPGVPFSCSSVGIIPVPVIMAGATSLKVMPLLPIF